MNCKVALEANHWIEKNKHNITIAIVTNLEPGPQEKFKNKGLRLSERYFSHRVISQFITGFRKLGIYTTVFSNESEFISSLASGLYPKNSSKYNFVYNLTESGIGAGGVSLISAVSRFYGLYCCNSDPHSSTMGRHKYHSYCVLSKNNIDIPESWWYFGDNKWCSDSHPPNGTVIIAKSSYESCSIGINDSSVFTYQGDNSSLDKVINCIEQPVFVQQYISGMELSVPVIVGKSAKSLEPVLNKISKSNNENFLLTERMVFDTKKLYKIKAENIDNYTIMKMKDAAERAAIALGFKGICRIDFKLCIDGRAFVIDVGAVPVLYKGSSVQIASSWMNISFTDILSIMLFCSKTR
ncbi:hypothetical protein L3V43_19815 [Pseudoalteromonas sp. L23]|uniref:hypothetical protein n=1 Tax=unclassified Pseudoalteromonas TaxID=194690 RepID=UPI001EF0AA28|nr:MULTISPECIES: hypothetical protein [unclassified Pseudoalteromonas]MCF7515862.1 hypothetical protein [Pseudoalteromonas sp. L7]MCF7527904.1 hypothetical protein [Pseudoalteromonas sp. L23]MCX2769756.1 hypothetical protein [Pseudoalteromonas sp. B530]